MDILINYEKKMKLIKIQDRKLLFFTFHQIFWSQIY